MSKKIYLFSTSAYPGSTTVNSLDIQLFKPSIDFSQYDYLIITSKQALRALTQYDKNEYINTKALCVSTKSAESFKDLGGDVLDIGTGYGDNLIEKIKSYDKSIKWLYLRAKVVASAFVEVCKKDGYSIDEIVVYESQCSKKILGIKVEDESILIFTSPSSLKCFMQKNAISTKSSIIVIGNTTAKAVPKNIEFILSPKRTIQSCMEIALRL